MKVVPNQRWSRKLSWLAAHPRRAAILATLLLSVFAALVRAPVIEGSMIDRISGAGESLRTAREVQAATGDLTMAAVIVTPAAISIEEGFASLAALRSRLTRVNSRIEVESIDSVAEQLFLYGLSTDDRLATLLHKLAGNPGAGVLIGRDQSRFLVAVTFTEDAADEVIGALLAHPWANVATEHRVVAGAQLEKDIARSLTKDLWLLIPAIIVTMLTAIMFAFGSWRAGLLPAFCSAASTVVTFGLFSATGVTINLITLLALPVVLIVGLANSCHFLSKSSSAAVAENDVAEAVSATVRRVGPPFFVSSLTTAIALLSLSFNDIGPIADLGRIAAAALLIVFVLVMLAAPLSLRWYLQHSTRSWRQSRAFQGLSRALFTDRQLVSVVLLVLMLASALSIPFLTMKSDPRALFPDDAPFSRTLRFFEQEFFVFAPLRVVVAVDAAAGDGLFALSQAGEIRALLESGAGVRQVSMRPGTQDAATFVLTALLDSDAALGPAIKRIDERRAALPAGVRVMYSSAPLVYNDIDRRASDSLLRSLGWSVALIFGAMLLVFRSALAVVGTMLANAVPLALVCGFVWLSGNPLNLVTVFVFLVALGVIVDDAIHILFARGAGDRLTGSSIEFSVLLTTAMLCLGLLLCQLSDFPTTREFSAYCALALVAAVISNLTVLPWLLDRLGSRRHTE